MTKDLVRRYVWMVDILKRHGHLSRREISELWLKADVGDGNPLPERTFFHYRRAIEEIFHIDILCDAEGRYYIDPDTSRAAMSLSNWLLDSYAVNEALSMDEQVASWVEVEDVPSAREHLPHALDALRRSLKVRFTYGGFKRTLPEEDILFTPYLLKRYKNRWYMIGLKEDKKELRTYALDRVKSLSITEEAFVRPKDLDISEIFSNIIGVTSSPNEVREVKLQATPMQAKYFRALPLHPTQTELVADDYSIFTYRLKINYELVHELMALGGAVKVLAPAELRVMVKNALSEALDQYD
ncbi:MAG: WYL domain-containing protein [Muribaculum sp.]|nr:WYL domain-containing protein [Muribaculum sp.]